MCSLAGSMQSSVRSQPAWRKEHLWLYLQALGFEAVVANKTLDHVSFAA